MFLSGQSVMGLQGLEASQLELLAAATCVCPSASPLLIWAPRDMHWHGGALVNIMRLLAYADSPHAALLLFRCARPATLHLLT